jgi:hypothetical protein
LRSIRTKTLPFLSTSSSSQERDDHALGAVDDERAPLGHPREVAHEHRLLADLARLAVDEADRDGQRARVGEVLLAALLERRDGLVEGELAELDGEVARVVLDRGDVIDRLAQPALLGVHEPIERLLLDVDQIGDVKCLIQPRERATDTGSVNCSQDGDSWARRESRARGTTASTSGRRDQPR